MMSAYGRGFAARSKGRARRSNPYLTNWPQFRNAWFRGWDKRDAEIDARLFDALPKQVRKALTETVQKWTANAATNTLREGYSADQVAAFIRHNDMNFVRATSVLNL
jgi:hypothetical protein